MIKPIAEGDEHMNGWKDLRQAGRYPGAVCKWAAVSVAIGGTVGAVGAAFHHCVDYAAIFSEACPWLLWCLPLAGLAIVGIYRLAGVEGLGSDAVLDAALKDRRLPWPLVPAIFLGTALTHLCGGSAGREGAALQIGGTIGQGTGRLLRMNGPALRTATLTGMAACFSALFGTPLAAAVFAVTCCNTGMICHAALLPCLLSALTAYGAALALHVEPVRFAVAAVPALTPVSALRTAALAALCGLLSMLFCGVIQGTHRLLARYLSVPWIRAVAGGCALIALTYLTGNRDYNGAGMSVIAAAVQDGNAHPAAFLLKLLFTAVTLGAGFKGGEVVPSLFVGAAFGCTAAPLLGLPAGFGAALGMVSVFCGAANCPVAAILLSAELLGGEGLPLFALACTVSYVLSGSGGLYASQIIPSPKVPALHANANHAEETLSSAGPEV